MSIIFKSSIISRLPEGPFDEVISYLDSDDQSRLTCVSREMASRVNQTYYFEFLGPLAASIEKAMEYLPVLERPNHEALLKTWSEKIKTHETSSLLRMKSCFFSIRTRLVDFITYLDDATINPIKNQIPSQCDSWYEQPTAVAFESVARSYQAIGMLACAEQVAGRITAQRAINARQSNQEIQDQVLADLSESWIQSGDLKSAIRSVQSIHDGMRKRSAIKQISVTLEEQDRFEDAMKLFEKFDPSNSTGFFAEGRACVLTTLLQTGNIERAVAVAKEIRDDFQKDAALLFIAENRIGSGDFEQTGWIAELIANKYLRTNCLEQYSKVCANAGEFVLARKFAFQMISGYQRDDVVWRIFTNQIRTLHPAEISSAIFLWTTSKCAKYLKIDAEEFA